jgi:ribosomal protein S18 acetylase RimI-like enzyme
MCGSGARLALHSGLRQRAVVRGRRRLGLRSGMDRAGTSVRVEEAAEVSDALVSAVQRLVRQLSSSSVLPTADELTEIVVSPASRLLLAREASGAIVGMLTLALFRIPTGVRARIEDVVVDEAARGRGVGATLTRAALRLAASGGARTVDLTSHPDRDAANRLYVRLGFSLRDTNVYRLVVPPPD